MTSFVLAFDTSTEVCAMALGTRGDDGSISVVAENDFDAPRAAMSRLLPAVASMLGNAGIEIRGIDELVVGRGPGSFTGVRIGVATAKGIAHGLGVPLFGVSTLDAVAWSFPGFDGLLGVVGDAMRGEVYPAVFRIREGSPVRLGPDRVARPEQVAEEWAALGEPVVLAGNGLVKYENLLVAALGSGATVAPRDSWAVTGRGLLKAYEAALSRGEQGTGDAGALLPIYTRLSDAEQAEQLKRGSDPDTTPVSGVHGPVEDAAPGGNDAST